MGKISTISSKGQITLPVDIRTRLGVKSGDQVEFYVEDGKTVLRPVRPAGNPFEEWVGVLPAFATREEINAWVREMRDGDEGPE